MIAVYKVGVVVGGSGGLQRSSAQREKIKAESERKQLQLQD